MAGRAAHRDLLMVWEDNIDAGGGIIPIHLLNPICAVHLRQEHGFKRWQTGRFKETFPWLIREDDTFAFAALHYLVHVLVHVEEGAVPLDGSGTVAFVRQIKPPGVTDHQHP
jgi:hypothetical protein